MIEKLTLQILKDMPPHKMFTWGNLIDSPSHINITGSGKELRWCAIRGGIHDWAIYVQPDYEADEVWDNNKIAMMGDKLHNDKNIKMLVLCDDEAFKMYRH